MTKFFLRRPIFAAVCSLVVLLAGLIVMPTLPIAQYPRIAPPVVTVSATYLGASAEEVESSVTVPLEEAINGVEGLRYITSQSTNNGASTITCSPILARPLDLRDGGRPERRAERNGPAAGIGQPARRHRREEFRDVRDGDGPGLEQSRLGSD